MPAVEYGRRVGPDVKAESGEFMAKRVTAIAIVFYALILGFSRSEAYEFRPTEQEWANWPGYCKARYVGTNIGRSSKFINRAGARDQQELAQWENAGMRGIHHFCAGTAWLYRARMEDSAKDRDYQLTEARRETQFSLDRSNRSAPQFAMVAIQMATAMYEHGNGEEAVKLLLDLSEFQPRNDILYSATAVYQGKLGRHADAKATLLKGDAALEGASAEIQYNLGLVSIELGELEDARKYAESAYKKGYPLPGLRAKLERLGHM